MIGNGLDIGRWKRWKFEKQNTSVACVAGWMLIPWNDQENWEGIRFYGREGNLCFGLWSRSSFSTKEWRCKPGRHNYNFEIQRGKKKKLLWIKQWWAMTKNKVWRPPFFKKKKKKNSTEKPKPGMKLGKISSHRFYKAMQMGEINERLQSKNYY